MNVVIKVEVSIIEEVDFNFHKGYDLLDIEISDYYVHGIDVDMVIDVVLNKVDENF